MELPASPEALALYEQQLRERYGPDAIDEIAITSLYLALHPNDPRAHSDYFDAIERIMKGVTR